MYICKQIVKHTVQKRDVFTEEPFFIYYNYMAKIYINLMRFLTFSANFSITNSFTKISG